MLKKIPLASLYADKKFLLERVMCYLAEIFRFNNDEIADFSNTLFILPSSEAGRLFREKAAIFFKEHGGVTELHTLLPEQLIFDYSLVDIQQAKVMELWLDVLKNAIKNKQSQLLPSDVQLSDETLLTFTGYFTKIRENILLESGIDSDEFINSLPDSVLRTKLEEYLKLEKIYRSQTGNLRDKAQVIADAPLPDAEKIKNIILIECSEIKNGIVNFLNRASEKINVIHCLNITENELDDFDDAGRPITENLLNQNTGLSLYDSFRSYSNPVTEAMKIATLLDKDNLPSSIGVLNNELADSLSHFLEAKGIEVYAPKEKPLQSFYWSKLFCRLLELRKKNIPFEAVAAWAEDDSFCNYSHERYDAVSVRAEMEKMQRTHLISDFASLCFFCRRHMQQDDADKKFEALSVFCRKLEQLANTVRAVDENSMPEGIWGIFSEVASANTFEYMEINSAESSLESLKNIIIQLRKINDPDVRMMIFKHMLRNESIADAEQFKDEAINFSGYLDLIWYENNSLIIGGISEDAFSTAGAEDMLFPENVRRSLKWSSAYSRFGADIHRFRQLTRQYEKNEILITFAAANKSGSLYTLPRLLFAVNDERLIEHCKLLFSDELNEKITSKNETDIQYTILSPDFNGKLPQNISVTGFKKYIDCPYTFYLSNILYCEEPGEEIFELQPNQSGDIIHSILESYGKKYRDTIPELDELNNFCLHEFDRVFHAQLGNTINNIAIMQGAEIKKSLIAFAVCENAFRKSFQSHEILHTEFKINVTFDKLWQKLPSSWTEKLPPLHENVKNIRIVGKIDRIDLATGNDGIQVCHIIDYKSAKKPESPAEAHLNSKNSAHLDDEAMTAFYDSDKTVNLAYFADMQLIIYKLMAQFMREDLQIPPDIPIKCGYFNLPEETGNTEIVFFNLLNEKMLENGAKALHHLMHRIFVDCYFWPPSSKSRYGVARNYFGNINDSDFEITGGEKQHV